MDIAVVTGNPKPASRTLAAAVMVAENLAGAPPQVVVDVVELGATCPTKGLYMVDTSYDDPTALEPWLSVARPQVVASIG